MDFETYSPAGYVFNPLTQHWDKIQDGAKGSIEITGASVYTEHPDAQALCLAYNLQDGTGPHLWVPWLPEYPLDLFAHLSRGGLIEAHNCSFEWYVWHNICVPQLGWPPFNRSQLRDTIPRARAWGLPGKLKDISAILDIHDKKIEDGKRLIGKFCVPHNPTKHDKRLRINISELPHGWFPDAEDAAKFYGYNLGDIAAESEISGILPELSPYEFKLWQLDQRINAHGCYIDMPSVDACIDIVNQSFAKYNTELLGLTGIDSINKGAKIIVWAATQGYTLHDMNKETVKYHLTSGSPPPAVRRVLEIRQIIGAASIKKLFSIKNRTSRDGFLRDLFEYHGAGTGRWAGRGPQPQNLPKKGPKVRKCSSIGCYYAAELPACPRCFLHPSVGKEEPWGINAIEFTLDVIKTRNLDYVERMLVDPIDAVAGCLRGLFISSPWHDLICSDYSAIEAVVLAELAGEAWRQEVFRTHGKIYEISASKITGIPFEEFLRVKKETDEHHPLRGLGKVAELASGYQGGYGAWVRFGALDYLSPTEIRGAIKAWRASSPAIVSYWHSIERCAVQAIQNPGRYFEYRGICFGSTGAILYCQLLSGRLMAYQSPSLGTDELWKDPEGNWSGKDNWDWGKYPAGADDGDRMTVNKIYYWAWNTDSQKGPVGWMQFDAYGGSLTENIVQATARDILADALLRLEAAGYMPVLHVHDEPVCEVPEGFGGVEEFEKIMSTMPVWATGWPVKAADRWRGKRYRK